MTSRSADQMGGRGPLDAFLMSIGDIFFRKKSAPETTEKARDGSTVSGRLKLIPSIGTAGKRRIVLSEVIRA
ncbi:MAG: hypothetical protein VX589_01385 [Myxococcota bacterium]|nr:hypothetical protein [Myxococcota bacterium]